MSKHSCHPSSNESQDNTDVQFAIMEEEIKTLKKKDHKYKSKASS